jgi:hypothetical protein
MARTGTQTRSRVVIPLLLIWASISTWGQQAGDNDLRPRLAMPEWLAPFPQARDLSAGAASAEVTASYTAPAQAADVITHYELQMRTAGVAFKTQSDGIGVSIVASAERVSAVVRIREDDGVSKVKVSYAVTPDKTAGLVLAASQSQTAPPQRAIPVSLPASSSLAPGKRAPISPYARAPYAWILQSVVVRGSHPAKYTASYYQASTDGTALQPLPLPGGTSIVDVFPQDCAFSLQDQEGHSFTFNRADEAKGRELAPGAWSYIP